IDDDHEVTGVDVRREDRLVLASEKGRGVGRQAAQHNVRSVDDVPLTLNLTRLRAVRTHRFTLSRRRSLPATGLGDSTEAAQQRSTIPGTPRQGQNAPGARRGPPALAG